MNARTYSISLPSDLVERLEQLAEVTGERFPDNVRRALTVGLDVLLTRLTEPENFEALLRSGEIPEAGIGPIGPRPSPGAVRARRAAEERAAAGEIARERLRGLRARYAAWTARGGAAGGVEESPARRAMREEWESRVRVAELRLGKFEKV